MKLELKRIALKPNYTIGKLFINGTYYCDTIEDKVIDLNKNGKFDDGLTKVMHQTAIPYGTFKVVVNHSPKFNRELPRLLDVPYFEGILIHNGSDQNSSSGCIIVGENKTVGKVTNSTFYMNNLTARIKDAQNKGETTTITIS
jgi:hypothetical protein|nr:MAG TPA: hypothetical protein [Bacteriophage sp.]